MVLPAAFTEAYILDYIKTRLGESVVDVELSEPQIRLCIEDTVELFERHRPRQYIQASYLNDGIHEITPPEDNMGVLDVDYTMRSTTDMSVEAALLYDPFYFISSGAIGGLDIQLYDMTRHWMEIAGRVLSGEFEWEMTDEGLFILTPFNVKCRITWAMTYEDLTQLRKEYHPLFLNLVLAKSRQILGSIRSKYAGVPAAGGMMQLDGEWLREKGAADEEKYVDELMRTSLSYIPSYG